MTPTQPPDPSHSHNGSTQPTLQSTPPTCTTTILPNPQHLYPIHPYHFTPTLHPTARPTILTNNPTNPTGLPRPLRQTTLSNQSHILSTPPILSALLQTPNLTWSHDSTPPTPHSLPFPSHPQPLYPTQHTHPTTTTTHPQPLNKTHPHQLTHQSTHASAQPL